VGPLATYAEPHTYDLCLDHAERLTVPRGWDVVRLDGDYSEPALAADDLLALADAVREAGRPREAHPSSRQATSPPEAGAAGATGATGATGVEGGRRGHLRILRDE
jgi:hypothetical protein